LVVDEGCRRAGVGRALVEELVRRLGERGVGVLYLGSDDEDELTSLGGRDLFPGVLGHLRSLADRRGHPFGFYQRLGFEVVGVIPDANGPGRHDILMARSLRPSRRA
jgi:aminoglycoside 6'-N-acetyltransferase I